MYDKNEKMFMLTNKDSAIGQNKHILQNCIPFYQKVEHNIGGED